MVCICALDSFLQNILHTVALAHISRKKQLKMLKIKITERDCKLSCTYRVVTVKLHTHINKSLIIQLLFEVSIFYLIVFKNASDYYGGPCISITEAPYIKFHQTLLNGSKDVHMS
jgi:hypothetical protein